MCHLPVFVRAVSSISDRRRDRKGAMSSVVSRRKSIRAMRRDASDLRHDLVCDLRMGDLSRGLKVGDLSRVLRLDDLPDEVGFAGVGFRIVIVGKLETGRRR